MVVNLPKGKSADAYIAPKGEKQSCVAGENRFRIPPLQWMRLVGLTRGEMTSCCEAE